MKIDRLVRPQKESGVHRARLLMVCFFFLLGVSLSRALRGLVGQDEDLLLREYLLQYAGLMLQDEESAASILTVLWTYFRYPLLLFLAGLTAMGVVAIPLLWIVQGCSLAFSVACFTSAMGRSGVLLALVTFGVRSLFVLPCGLLLSLWSLDGALQRFRERGQRQRGKKKGPGSSQHYLRCAVCFAVILIGVIVELSLVPKLLKLALVGIS